MGQTLTNGVYLPDNGERNCYTGLSQNWQKLDNLLGNQGSNVSFSQTLTEGVEIGKITINGTEVAMYHTDYSGKADASNVYTKTEVDTSLNAKQDSLTDTQLSAVNSGITSDKVATYDGYASTKVNKSGDTMTGDLLGNGSNNLGTSSNKWKTINGINPGALSLPSNIDKVTLTLSPSTRWTNTYFDGWLCVVEYTLGDNWLEIYNETNGIQTCCTNVVSISNNGWCKVYMPIRKGDNIVVNHRYDGNGFQSTLYKCQGNV